VTDVLAKSKASHRYLFGKSYPTGICITSRWEWSSSRLILAAVTLWAIAVRSFRHLREILYLTIPPATYMTFSIADGLNLGIWHMLPVYVSFFMLIAGAVWQLDQTKPKSLYVAIALFVFRAVSVTRVQGGASSRTGATGGAAKGRRADFFRLCIVLYILKNYKEMP
jgi:hypothetical protein